MKRVNLAGKGNSSHTMSCFGNAHALAFPGVDEESSHGMH